MTTASAEVVNLGTWAVDDVPPPLVFTFYEDDGATVVDLSDFVDDDVTFYWRRSRTTTEVARTSAEVVGDGTAGQVSYAWVAGDAETAGVYRARFVADNAVNRYSSPVLVWEVQSVT